MVDKTLSSNDISSHDSRWPSFLELEACTETSQNPAHDHAFRTLIENLPIMCYVAEPDPPYAPIYSSAHETFGYSLDEWRTDRDLWFRAVHPDDREGVV